MVAYILRIDPVIVLAETDQMRWAVRYAAAKIVADEKAAAAKSQRK